jgi:uncharacterized protein (TIGR03437 family)
MSQPGVAFDFDSGTPALKPGQSIPVEQTSSGLTARFTSPGGSAFSVQNAASTGLRLSQFSGNYLYDNNVDRSTLVIQFSQPIAGVSFKFATGDFDIEVPSTIQLTAYLDSNTTPAVGTAATHGAYGADSFPMGTLNFNPAGRPFNLVEITVPFAGPRGATVFFLDNLTVTPLSSFAVVSAASFSSGSPVAPNSIASGFGQGLATREEGAVALPLPTTLAGRTLKVRDNSGVERQAPLFYVGPAQVNWLVPDGTAPGLATVTLTDSAGSPVAGGTTMVEPVAPGLFTANADGRGAPAALAITVAPDQTQTIQDVARCGTALGSCVTSSIDLGTGGTQVFLSLYGTGIRARSSVASVTAKIGGVDAELQYAGAQSELAGLDQVNVLIPRTLAGRGEVDLTLTVDGRTANTVRVNIR